MTSSAATTRLPWEDRWNKPTVKQLLDSVSAESRRVLRAIIAALNGYDAVHQRVVWYGPGWNWTIQYQLPAAKDSPEDTDILCYLVPKSESPLVCVPLCGQEIDSLPVRRLNRIIREGIRLAKCAVTVSWATFTPASEADAEHVIDLIRRKHKGAAATIAQPKRKTTAPKRRAGRTTALPATSSNGRHA